MVVIMTAMMTTSANMDTLMITVSMTMTGSYQDDCHLANDYSYGVYVGVNA